MIRPVASLFALLPMLFACSSSYEPARSPRITMIVEDGSPTFVKDGRRYGGPVFATGLVDAVRGNPRAEDEARTGRNLAIGGFVLDMAGLGSDITALAVLGQNDQHAPTALGLAVVGLTFVAIGSGLLLSAPPHIYDAVNIYNDGVDADAARRAPPPLPLPLPPPPPR